MPMRTTRQGIRSCGGRAASPSFPNRHPLSTALPALPTLLILLTCRTLIALAILLATALLPTSAQTYWSDPYPITNDGENNRGADLFPQIVSDGGEIWIAVWESTDNLNGSIGNDFDILFSRSVDKGLTWTYPFPLNADAASDQSDDKRVQIATDGAGNWVAVWTSTILRHLSDTNIFVSHSADNGESWSAPNQLNAVASSYRGLDWGPQVTTDGRGLWIATWIQETTNNEYDILISHSIDNGVNWNVPVTLDPGESFNDQPRVATDRSGHWIVVWASVDYRVGTAVDRDYDIRLCRSTDNGHTWTAPTSVNLGAQTDTSSETKPDIATGGNGTWIVTWADGISTNDSEADQDIFVSRSNDNGASWTTETSLDSASTIDPGIEDRPRISTDGSGEWTVAWESDEWITGTDIDILVSRSNDNGTTWTSSAPLTNASANNRAIDMAPHVSAQPDGSWIAAWHSYYFADPGWDIWFSRSVDRGVQWSTPKLLNGNAGLISPEDSLPSLSTDLLGNMVMVWMRYYRYPFETISGSHEILFSRSSDYGLAWTSPAPLNSGVSQNSYPDGNPTVSNDGQGTWIVAWNAQNGLGGALGSDWDILISYSFDEGVSWAGTRVLNPEATTDVWDEKIAQIVPDGNGAWLATWTTTRSDPNIVIARSEDGGVTWNVIGHLNAVNYPSSESNPRLALDGSGNIVVAWNSYRTVRAGEDSEYLNFTIWVSRSADNGITWANPEAVYGYQFGPNYFLPRPTSDLTTDRDGNWILAWPVGDILISRSTDAGASWDTPKPIMYPHSDLAPKIAANMSGDWVVTWESRDSPYVNNPTDPDILMSRSSDYGDSWSTPINVNTDASSDSNADEEPQLSTDGFGHWLVAWKSTEWDYSDGDSDIFISRSLLPLVNSIVPNSLILTNAATVDFLVTFEGIVSGVDAGDFAIVAEGLSGAGVISVSQDTGNTRTVTVASGEGSGTLRLDVVDNDTIIGILDQPLGGAGLGNGDFSRGDAYIVDRAAPEAALSSTAPETTNADSIPVMIALSESVDGFSEEDIALANAALANFALTDELYRRAYRFDLVPIANGPFSASIPASSIFDPAGNPNPASNVLTRIFDTTGPSAAIESFASEFVNGPIHATLDFSEPVSGLDESDIETVNATVTNLAAAKAIYNAEFRFDIIPIAEGPFSVNVLMGAVIDSTGNPNSTSNAVTRIFDSTPPTVLLSSTVTEHNGTAAIPVSAIFSEPVTGLQLDDLVAGNAAVLGLAGGDAEYTFLLTPSGPDAVSVYIRAIGVVDAAGNGNLSSNVLAMDGPGVPVIRLSTNALEFGAVAIGDFAELMIEVENAGEGSLSGLATASPPFQVVSGVVYALGPDERQAVTVRFAPEVVGSQIGVLEFNGTTDTQALMEGEGILPVSSATGQVTADDGEPIACVTLAAMRGEEVVALASANALGNYTLRGLLVDEYTIVAYAPGFAPQTIYVTLDGSEFILDLPMEDIAQDAAIRGKVSDGATGDPVGGIVVEAFVGEELVARTFTCTSGAYELRDVAASVKGAGSVRLEFSGETYAPVTVEIDLPLGEAVERNIGMDTIIVPASLSGTVYAEGVGPLAGAEVMVSTASGFATSAITGGDGRYAIGNAPPDVDLFVSIVAPDFLPLDEAVTLPVGETVTDYVLFPADQSGEGEGEGERGGCSAGVNIPLDPPSKGDLLLLVLSGLALWSRRKACPL